MKNIDELLLGGELRYTKLEAIKLAGVDEEFTHRLWRAFGFAEVDDGQPAFTENDVAALVRIRERLDEGFLTEDTVIQLVRAVGQTMARLAEWQTNLLTGLLFEPGATADEAAVSLVESHLQEMEPLLIHAWRRQLAAAVTRVLEPRDPGTNVQAVVGFADMVSFTRLSRDLGDNELAAIVEKFESVTADIVAAAGARVVKTLGDEVLFTAETPAVGAEIALDIAAAIGADPLVPAVRVGVAYGSVVPLMGDVFGTTVNLASRLTSMARPGTVLVDERLAGEVAADPTYALVRIVRRPARGLGMIQPYVLRRSAHAG